MPVTDARREITLPPALRAFALAVVLLTALCWGAELFCVHVLHLDRVPYNRLTLVASDDFADIVLFRARYDHFHHSEFFSPANGYTFQYPAPVGLLYLPFEPRIMPAVVFETTLSLICVALMGWFFLALRSRGLALDPAAGFALVSMLFSYPMFFEANRANMEIFVWLLSGLGVLAFVRDRMWLAAVLIGLAGACKGYPYIYLGLFFARKKYWEMAASVLVGFATNAAAMWLLAGNFAAGKAGVAYGLEQFRTGYVLRRRFDEVGLDHSIFGFIKRFWYHPPPPDQLAHVLNVYLAVAALAAGLIYLFFAMRLPVINQVLFLTVAALVLPPTSFDYTLLHLYTPWVMLVFLIVELRRRGKPLSPGLWAVCCCFMLLLSPQNELIYHGERLEGQVKCVVLLATAFLALRYPFAQGEETALREAA